MLPRAPPMGRVTPTPGACAMGRDGIERVGEGLRHGVAAARAIPFDRGLCACQRKAPRGVACAHPNGDGRAVVVARLAVIGAAGVVAAVAIASVAIVPVVVSVVAPVFVPVVRAAVRPSVGVVVVVAPLLLPEEAAVQLRWVRGCSGREACARAGEAGAFSGGGPRLPGACKSELWHTQRLAHVREDACEERQRARRGGTPGEDKCAALGR
jgi:hypothetical protein